MSLDVARVYNGVGHKGNILFSNDLKAALKVVKSLISWRGRANGPMTWMRSSRLPYMTSGTRRLRNLSDTRGLPSNKAARHLPHHALQQVAVIRPHSGRLVYAKTFSLQRVGEYPWWRWRLTWLVFLTASRRLQIRRCPWQTFLQS